MPSNNRVNICKATPYRLSKGLSSDRKRGMRWNGGLTFGPQYRYEGFC